MKTTFKIATADAADAATMEGDVALLKVGGKPHRFVIHGTSLSDYRTGMRVGSFHGVLLNAAYAKRSISHRTAAETLLAQIIEKHGVERVLKTLATPPTVNA